MTTITPTPATEIEEHETSSRSFGWYGMVFFLASEAVFFANLIAAYLYLRVRAGAWPPTPYGGHIFLDKTLASVNTVILLCSSFPMHYAARGIAKGDRRALKIGLALTAILGLCFLGGQAYEYMHTTFGPGAGVFGSTFFILTGFHGAHVSAGVVFLLVCWLRSMNGHFTKDKHFPIQAVEMYWHFVDVVWIILFTVLYLL